MRNVPIRRSTKPIPRESEKHRLKRLAEQSKPVSERTPRKPIAKVGKQKAKRQARNKAYYASVEWRAKRKAVFERDGFQCVETREMDMSEYRDRIRHGVPLGGVVVARWSLGVRIRCGNRGEVVNGKQTARGLVCEESSYGHRGNPEYIDTCKTRCRDCDRRLTPLERINHANGFSGRAHVGESA
jgi:hypothetical protein